MASILSRPQCVNYVMDIWQVMRDALMRWHMSFEIALLATRVVYVDPVPVK